MIRPIKVVAFDLDDTLIPEALFIKSGVRHIANIINKSQPKLPRQRSVGCMETAMMSRKIHN